MMGLQKHNTFVKLKLEKNIIRNKTDRRSWLPVKITGAGSITEIPYHGSAHINAYVEADGLVHLKQQVKELRAGSLTEVILF